jgi:DNA-binding Xre family transcriptional regulator
MRATRFMLSSQSQIDFLASFFMAAKSLLLTHLKNGYKSYRNQKREEPWITEKTTYLGYIAGVTMIKKAQTTYDRLIKDPCQKKLFDKEYQELLLSELLIAAMKEDDISVRALAKEAGISPTIIQGLRTGKRKNVTLSSFLKILEALGYSFVIEKKRKIRNHAKCGYASSTALYAR